MSDLVLDYKLWDRQLEAFNSPATELLFGGASSGGKSHFTRVALIVWSLWIPGLQSSIFRKHFDDVIGNHMPGPTGFRRLLRPLEEQKKVKIVETECRFSNGSIISLEHCLDDRALDKHQGRDKHVLVLEEATQIQERHIRFLRGWVRMPIEMQQQLPPELAGRFPRIIYTANPIGVSVGYFRRHFVKARPAHKIEQAEDLEGGFMRQYIPSRVEDNLSVDAEAQRRRLRGLGDAATADALETGNWDAPVGDFFREWDDSKHVVPNFQPPDHWFKFRSFDWGTAEPFIVYWWAVSDGESFTDYKGEMRWFPRGAIVAYREWNGCNPDKPAEGLRMRNEEMAQGILERSPDEGERRVVTLTDSLPFQDRGGKTIAETFAENGVLLTHGDTKRIPGWSQMRDRLKGKQIDSNDAERTPMMFFCECCTAARDYIPALPRHKTKAEDAAESGEATHSCFIAGTQVKTPSGQVSIESLCVGDKVIAGDGEARKISAVGLTGKKQPVVRLTFLNDREVVCTPDHKILTTKGWTRACDAMGLACIVGECESRSYQAQFKSLTGSDTSFARNTISDQEQGYIGQCGVIIKELSQKVITSITKTKTEAIIKSETLSFLRRSIISVCTARQMLRRIKRRLTSLDIVLLSGTRARKAENGIKNIIKSIQQSNGALARKRFAHLVERSLPHIGIPSFALAGVSSDSLLPRSGFMSQQDAEYARKIFSLRNTDRRKHVHKAAPSNFVGKTVQCLSVENAGKADVFCLTEPVTHSFQLVNSLVVKNCDAIRLACMARARVMDEEAPYPDTAELTSAISFDDAITQIKKHKDRANGSRW